MRCYVFLREPSDASYQALIELCCTFASTLLLVSRDRIPNQDPVFERLQPSFLVHEATSKWPGTTLLGHEASAMWYATSRHLELSMKGLVSGLFEWLGSGPEDPCFFREEGTVLLTTISHEREAYLFLREEELDAIQELPALMSILVDEGPVEAERWILPRPSPSDGP